MFIFYRYLSHIEDQETLDKFHLHLFPDFGFPKEETRCLHGLRNKLWNVLDDHDSSIQSKVYHLSHLTLYPIETPINAFENRADPDLYCSCRYRYYENFVTSIARAGSIWREITVAILFTFFFLLSRLVLPLIRLMSKLTCLKTYLLMRW